MYLGKTKGLDEVIAMFQGLLSLYYPIRRHHLIQVSFSLKVPFLLKKKKGLKEYSCFANVVFKLLTAQRSELAICMHICPLLISFHLDHHGELSRVPYTIQ